MLRATPYSLSHLYSKNAPVSYDSPDAFDGFKKWHHTTFWYLGHVDGQARFGFLTNDTSMVKMMEKTYMDVRTSVSLQTATLLHQN